jgi:hypothetical protein
MLGEIEMMRTIATKGNHAIINMDESGSHMTDAWPDERRRVGQVTEN